MTTTQSIHPEQELPDSHVHTEINVGDNRGGAEQDSGLDRVRGIKKRRASRRCRAESCSDAGEQLSSHSIQVSDMSVHSTSKRECGSLPPEKPTEHS